MSTGKDCPVARAHPEPILPAEGDVRRLTTVVENLETGFARLETFKSSPTERPVSRVRHHRAWCGFPSHPRAVDRRDFLKFSGGVGMALALSGVAGAGAAEAAPALDDPEGKYRPGTRWWLAEGLHTDATIKADMKLLLEMGIGSVEIVCMPEPNVDSDLAGTVFVNNNTGTAFTATLRRSVMTVAGTRRCSATPPPWSPTA
ncbi:twin-arginine translocation signal domain-containing protein [Amycolatopsis sp. NPDC004368]